MGKYNQFPQGSYTFIPRPRKPCRRRTVPFGKRYTPTQLLGPNLVNVCVLLSFNFGLFKLIPLSRRARSSSGGAAAPVFTVGCRVRQPYIADLFVTRHALSFREICNAINWTVIALHIMALSAACARLKSRYFEKRACTLARKTKRKSTPDDFAPYRFPVFINSH